MSKKLTSRAAINRLLTWRDGTTDLAPDYCAGSVAFARDVSTALYAIERLRIEFLSDCETIGYDEDEALELLRAVEDGE